MQLKQAPTEIFNTDIQNRLFKQRNTQSQRELDDDDDDGDLENGDECFPLNGYFEARVFFESILYELDLWFTD